MILKFSTEETDLFQNCYIRQDLLFVVFFLSWKCASFDAIVICVCLTNSRAREAQLLLKSMKHSQEVVSKAKLQILINKKIPRTFLPFESKFWALHLPVHSTQN